MAQRRPALSVSVDQGTGDHVSTGFLIRDGVWARLREGTREILRDERGRPRRIVVEASDELDRTMSASGDVVSRQVFTAYPSMLCWDSLVRWELDGDTAWGEDQDVWRTDRWSAYARTLTAS